MSDPTDTYEAGAEDTTELPLDLANDTSARTRSQQRLSQARSAVSDAATRARQSAAFTSRRPTRSDDEEASGDVTTFRTLTDQAAAYRVHLAAGVLALLALVALVMKRRGGSDEDVVDLGEWHVRAEPLDE